MTAEYDAVASAYGVSFTSMPYWIYIEEWSVLAALGDIRNTSILDLALPGIMPAACARTVRAE